MNRLASLFGFFTPSRRSSAVPYWSDRLVMLYGYDLANPSTLSEIEHLLAEAAENGLTGVVWEGMGDFLPGCSPEYLKGVDGLSEICRKYGLDLIPMGFSPGSGPPFLNVNRHLAEGLKVENAPFLVGSNGQAELVPDPLVKIRNGDFEIHEGNVFEGFSFQDSPGSISFADREVFHSGRCSLRLENFASDPWGHGRINQVVPVRPYRSYRIGLWVKTEGLKHGGAFRVEALAPTEGEKDLLVRNFQVAETADWQKLSMVVNSREFDSLILVAGVWEGKSGKAWIDDWTIEEIGPQNVIRRAGTPIRVASEEGDAVYQEGRDFARLEDPYMNFTDVDRPAPVLKLLPRSRIRPGERLLVSWYHPHVSMHDKVGVCLAEEEVYSIIEAGARTMIERLRPKRMLLDFGEIRIAASCAKCKETDAASLIGRAAARAIQIIRKIDPGIGIMMWSDMFDPHENAREEYFHVRGSLLNTWRYIPRDITMVPHRWRVNRGSLDFLRNQGFPVLGSCYEDNGDIEDIKEWITTARSYRNVRGLMFTSWHSNYEMLPHFCELMK